MKIENNFILGDCLDVLNEIPDEIFDLLIIDFPYNLKKDFPNDNIKKIDFIKLLTKWIHIIILKLKEKGSFYAFMGYEFQDYLKEILTNKLILKNEIIWHYNIGINRMKKNYQSEYDKIFYFVKSNNYTFNDIRLEPSEMTIKRWKKYTDKNGVILWKYLNPKLKLKYKSKENYYKLNGFNIYKGRPVGNILIYPKVHSQTKERTNHPTQKPEKLIETFIKVSSNEGDLVGDFFAGSGTTLAVAKKLRRKYFGCEIEPKYYEIAKKRLESIIFTERNIQDYWRIYNEN